VPSPLAHTIPRSPRIPTTDILSSFQGQCICTLINPAHLFSVIRQQESQWVYPTATSTLPTSRDQSHYHHVHLQTTSSKRATSTHLVLPQLRNQSATPTSSQLLLPYLHALHPHLAAAHPASNPHRQRISPSAQKRSLSISHPPCPTAKVSQNGSLSAKKLKLSSISCSARR
jgi:hypothetical protein